MATLPELDLESLRLLVWIDELGSIGAAAGRAGISQPSASTKLKEFEARWRLLLVHRSTHGSHLTTDGKAVAAWAASVLHESELMQRSMVALGSRRQAGLVVAASLTIAEYMLPRWLGELNVMHEEIGVVLRVVNSAAAIRLVRRAQADMGFIETTEIPTDLGSRVVSPLAGYVGFSVTGNGFAVGAGGTNPGYFNSDSFQFADDVDTAFNILRNGLTRLYLTPEEEFEMTPGIAHTQNS